MLLTTLPADTAGEALRVTEYYGLRRLIEEYHKCLKSGCRVEERQLESAERLAPLIGMLSVVAVRLLQLKNDARGDPDAPAERCVPADLVRTMARLLKVAEPRTLSVRRFVHEVAKRGGFLDPDRRQRARLPHALARLAKAHPDLPRLPISRTAQRCG
jgi:hypothetical protein